MENGSPWIAIAVAIILIILNGILSSAEISLVSLKKIKLKQKSEAGDQRAKQLLQMKQDPGDFLSTIQIGITFAGLLSGAFAVGSLAKPFVKWFSSLGITGPWLGIIDTLTVLLVTFFLTYFMLVFGELVPKRIAMKYPYKIGHRFIFPIMGLSKIAKPLVQLLSFSTNTILHLFGMRFNQEDKTMTEEEILLIMREGREQGVVEESEEHIIRNLFKFTDLYVEDAMIHRTEIQAISADSSFMDVAKLMSETSHGKFPVFEGNMDKIVGIVYGKDFVSMISAQNTKTPAPAVRDIMRPPFFISESHLLVNLFSEMKKHKSYLAIVVDEYGGTSGMITMTDIIEEIVGNIETPEEEMIQAHSKGGYIIDGRTKVKDVAEFFKIKIDSDGNNTLSGFMIDSLGYVPSPGQTPKIEVEGFIFQVKKVKGALIDSLHVWEIQK